MKLDEKVIRCFTQLRSPEMQPLMEYLAALRLEALEMMGQVTDVDKIYRLQGKAGAIREILELVESAEVVIAKMNANRKIGNF